MGGSAKAAKSSKETNKPRQTHHDKSISLSQLRTCGKTTVKPALVNSKMVVEAIGALKQTAGSSRQAIAKFIEDKYGLPGNFNEGLSKQLTSLTEEGKIVQVRSSFKLAVKNLERVKAKEAKKAAAKTTTKKKMGPKEEKDDSAGSLRRRSKLPAAADAQIKSSTGAAAKTTTKKKVDAHVKSSTPAASASTDALVKNSTPAAGKFKGSSSVAAKKFKISTPAASTRNSPRFKAPEEKNKNKKRGGRK